MMGEMMIFVKKICSMMSRLPIERSRSAVAVSSRRSAASISYKLANVSNSCNMVLMKYPLTMNVK